MDIKTNKVTALIGPSGCGKSTFLRTLNRMNDLIDNIKIYRVYCFIIHLDWYFLLYFSKDRSTKLWVRFILRL